MSLTGVEMIEYVRAPSLRPLMPLSLSIALHSYETYEDGSE